MNDRSWEASLPFGAMADRPRRAVHNQECSIGTDGGQVE